MATRGWESVSVSDIASRQLSTATPKQSKYRNQRCVVGDEKFDSKREAEFWIALKAREAAGEIRDLKRQVAWALHCPTPGPDMEVCRYVADFQWWDTKPTSAPMMLHVADAKGVRTQVYRLKAKWMKLEHGITIEEL